MAAAVNDSRRNPAHAFLHARAAPFAHSGTHEAAAAVGGKRGRGAFEDDDCDEEEEGGRRRRGGAGSRRERAPPMDEYEAPMMGDTFNDAAGASALPANGLAINDNLSGRYLRAAIDEKVCAGALTRARAAADPCARARARIGPAGARGHAPGAAGAGAPEDVHAVGGAQRGGAL